MDDFARSDVDVARANVRGARAIVDALVALGVRHVVLAPGSRSTPLVAACAAQPQLSTYVVHDERSGAFIALGIGRASDAPAALVVTSGTALANATPAVVEADADRVPLIIVSADRPPEAQGTDANQTIDQQAFFGARSRAFVNLSPPDDIADLDRAQADLSRALTVCLAPVPGPVHVNAMFRKPLEPVAIDDDTAPSTLVLPTPTRRLVDYTEVNLKSAISRLAEAERGLVVCGAAHDAHERAQMSAVVRASRWPVVVEALSGLRDADLPRALASTALVAKAGGAPLEPDVVLWLGGALVSNEALSIVARATTVVRAEDRGRRRPEHARELVMGRWDPTTFAPALRDARAHEAGLVDDVCARRVLEAFAADTTAPLDEPFIAHAVARASRVHDGALFIGNSMPIRDVELFGGTSVGEVFANRGASGIDGLCSTAAGVAIARRGPITALVGDVSFLHDAGAWSSLAALAPSLRVVVVENGGGRIFEHLPIGSHASLLERYFVTPHTVDLVALARAYGVSACRVESRAELVERLHLPARSAEIVVARVDGPGQVAARRALFARVRDALTEQTP